MPCIVIEQFSKPFVNVETVCVRYGRLGCQFSSFPKWFPNVRHLNIPDSTLEHQFSNMSFQHLTQLKFYLN